MAETDAGGGQAAADSTGTTVHAPDASAGTSGSSAQTTGNGPDAGAIESFFDPTSIADKPELQAAYKQMQGSFTKRMQEMAKHRPKIDAYDRFEKDPMGTMRQLAAQYGWQLVQNGQNQEQSKDWSPQTWDDVLGKAKQEVMKDMKPVFEEITNLKKQNVETYLDNKFPDWRTYEPQMLETLQAHPSLVKDPDALYRLAVPTEVWQARATKEAMAKLAAKGEQAKISGGNATTKPTPSGPTGKLTFDQAVQAAKEKLAAQGLRRPAG